MADIKTHLRELSVATALSSLISNKEINFNTMKTPEGFYNLSKKMVSGDLTGASNILTSQSFSNELLKIIDNGIKLATSIYNNPHFTFNPSDKVCWLGNDTQKENPADISAGKYFFSLKEESFILENMGLYKLLNCYTGSNYKKRHIFNDYAPVEYNNWFQITVDELINYLKSHNGIWEYNNSQKKKGGTITLKGSKIILNYFVNGTISETSTIPVNCNIIQYEELTKATTREEVFAKFIKINLDKNERYNNAKRKCAIAASDELAKELNNNLNYRAGLPRFLRIHKDEYYYAKTTELGCDIYFVPDINSFGKDIVIESIVGSVPDKQANILTTIKNTSNNHTLVLRNECRFSHGQFNGTPEAKMYYERGGSLLVIYEEI